ncbi:hypothetical protein [Aurantivibrio infirmus]
MENQFSIADIILASILVNFNYGSQRIDEKSNPMLAAYFSFILKNDAISAALQAEQESAKTIPGFDFSFLQAAIY